MGRRAGRDLTRDRGRGDYPGLVLQFPLPATWDRDGLADVGFLGFVPLIVLSPQTVPTGHGIYAVLRPDDQAPHSFIPHNPVNRSGAVHYTTETLVKRWVSGANVLYIGKAMGQEGLRDRLRPYSRKSSSHSGGRAIWQLSEADQLLVCWAETPGLVPRSVETEYLARFRQTYGRLPFANIAGR